MNHDSYPSLRPEIMSCILLLKKMEHSNQPMDLSTNKCIGSWRAQGHSHENPFLLGYLQDTHGDSPCLPYTSKIAYFKYINSFIYLVNTECHWQSTVETKKCDTAFTFSKFKNLMKTHNQPALLGTSQEPES